MFLMKKLLSSFLSPLTVVFVILLTGLILLSRPSRRKSGRILVIIGVIILAFCSYTPTADLLLASLTERYPSYGQDMSFPNDGVPELIVVLGAGYDPDPDVPIVSRIGQDSLIRLIEGIRIYRKIPGATLILSGGSSTVKSASASDMADLAVELGVDERSIIVETKSRDTKDQAAIIGSMYGGKRIILVTSASHMARSVALFKKHGMYPLPAPVGSFVDKVYFRQPNPFFPSSVNLQKVEMAVHEYLGIIWGKIRGQI